MQYLRTLTVALLLGTLWPVGPVSDATAFRVMASSDVACGTGLGESSRSQRFVLRCDTCNSDWGLCHTDTVPRRTEVGKEEEHELKVSEHVALRTGSRSVRQEVTGGCEKNG